MSSGNCPNCDAELKGGILKSNSLLPDYKINIINEYHTPKLTVCCDRCGNDLYTSEISFSIYTCCEESGKILELLFFNYVFPVEVRYVNPQLMTDKI